ncbi:S-type pyocin domain-containing protein [Pectobacterium brasiliense]|uniref:S-type pyocin domain-containing protein n=1 Tax=Pectobacterium brasiliense TaxID=180957 RepID=UPI00227BAF59|nr:S-type pyocin domain-containing protein [Pectobacterium brasiliense]WGL29350.1 S-type pyocin domain-containing protein [Pectobacterium brasiliense]WJM81080.1 S-type pyocin domain-containing protein [Pectobacterium brasiliense]
MPGAARLNDIGSGHDCFSETPIIEGSSDVIINGQPAARQGDAVLLHGCPCPNTPHGVHSRKIAEGSSTVIINGKPAARIGDGINCGGVIISGSGNVIIGDTPHRSPVQDCAKQAALTRAPLLALTPMLAVEPVFAKSCLRGAGCTDAGKEDEPQGNIGEMSFYVAEPVEQANSPQEKSVEVKQYAQAAKKKNTSSAVSPPQSFAGKNEPLPKTSLGAINKPQIPPMEPWYKTVFDLLVGKADAAMLPPPQPVVMAGTAAQAGATAAAGGAVAQANQDAAKALSHQMKRLSGPSIWQGQLQMAQSFLLMGALIQQHLKGEKDDLLTQEKLLEVAKKQGTVPSRVRYQWVEDEETGRLKAVGYHTSMESGRDQVRVRLLKHDFPNNRYEFWEEGATGPTILWTPDNPGVELPTDTAHGEQPVIPSAVPGFEIPEMDDVSILATPMPDEKDFRDYILVFPINEYPPIYIYLSKPPVNLLDVDLYSNFKGRSRQGKYHADHMPSAAAVKAYLRRLYPNARKDKLEQMARDVAAIIIPAEIHQKISETYGNRNRPQDIERDSHDLRGAVDRNFDAIKPTLKEYGVTENQLESAREKMHKLNEEQGLY